MAGLTPEQLNQFNSAIAKARELTDRQAEIIDKLIEGETQLANTKIANLNTFFSEYFNKLDLIAHKCDDLPEIFQLFANASKSGKNNNIKLEFAVTDNTTNNGNSSGGSSGGGSGSSSGNNKKPKKSGPNYGSRPFEGEELELGLTEEELKKQEERLEHVQELIKSLSDAVIVNSKAANEHLSNQNALSFKETERYAERVTALKNEHRNELLKAERTFLNTTAALEIANAETTQAEITALQLRKMQEVTDAELAAATSYKKLQNEISITGGEEGSDIAGYLEAQLDAEKTRDAAVRKLEKQRLEYITKEELKAKRANNGILSAEAAKEILKNANIEFALKEENLEKIRRAEQFNSNINTLFDKNSDIRDRKDALKELTADNETTKMALVSVIGKLGDLAKQLETKMDAIAGQKGFIDTRLQGSSNEKFLGSYWDSLARDMISVGLITPFFRQEQFAANIKELVGQGIAFDVKQRAFLKTIQEKIANTFDVADGTLLRLIRLQQEDSTAGRLGMESALNTFLNQMYENTEYLNNAASSVRNSLAEMEAFMTGSLAAEVEYQVQKWMGSLYSVGMSQEAVNSIANAFGQIAAGQIEGLTGGGAGNLIVMAANDAGISIAEMLTNGIDSEKTNSLLEATVNYLAEIAATSANNQVVQQQLATVFGVRASDLRAATNLASKGSLAAISGHSKSYQDMIDQLLVMASSMGQRTSMGEMMSNIWENGAYSIANAMSNNPVSYLIYKLAGLLDSTTGGIALPFVNAMGFGVDLNTTVADLMRVAAVGSGLFMNLAPMVQGLGSSFSGRAMLAKMGIESGAGLAVTPRGNEIISSAAMDQLSTGISASGYIGNSSSSDIKNATLQEASDTKKSLMVEAQEEQGQTPVDEINMNVFKIYELLSDVVSGASTLRVRVDSYGLVNAGNHGGFSSNYLAGPSGLAGQSASLAANSGYIGNAPNTQAGISQYFSGALDIGSWVLG